MKTLLMSIWYGKYGGTIINKKNLMFLNKGESVISAKYLKQLKALIPEDRKQNGVMVFNISLPVDMLFSFIFSKLFYVPFFVM